jgi:hypothetical protein
MLEAERHNVLASIVCLVNTQMPWHFYLILKDPCVKILAPVQRKTQVKCQELLKGGRR